MLALWRGKIALWRMLWLYLGLGFIVVPSPLIIRLALYPPYESLFLEELRGFNRRLCHLGFGGHLEIGRG